MVASLQERMLVQLTTLRGELIKSQVQRERMMTWGVRVLHSKNCAVLLRQSMAAWKVATWDTTSRAVSAVKVHCLLSQRGHRQISAVFLGWRVIAQQLGEARWQADKMCKRIGLRRLEAYFASWLLHTRRAVRNRAVVARRYNFLAHRLQRQAMLGWCTAIARMRRNRQILAHRFQRMKKQSMRQTLLAWHECSQARLQKNQVAMKCLQRYRRLPMSLQSCWTSDVMFISYACEGAKCCPCSWQQTCPQSRMHQRFFLGRAEFTIRRKAGHSGSGSIMCMIPGFAGTKL
jgi:hypothetical protein